VTNTSPARLRTDLFSTAGKPLTTSLDAGVPLRDVQEAASHADPRTTMRYDNSRELHQMGEPNRSFRELAA
jgi:hypothetical protein